MVGREQEAAFLLARWQSALEGGGQAVLVAGDPGIGKTRLIEALREHVEPDAHSWLELRSSAYHQNSAFRPVIELLRRSFQFAPDDAPEEQVARLEVGLEHVGLPTKEMLPLFCHLLSLPPPVGFDPLHDGPELLRKRTLEAMCAWILALADQRPLIIVAEDLHWTDPSTVEFLGLLIEQGQWYPMLLVATHRPEFVPPWTHAHLAVLPLRPLGVKDVRELVTNIAGGKRVPAKVLEYLLEKSDGVPLFVEELTRGVLDSELLRESDESWERTDPLPGLSVPLTLQDSLESRLDRLGPAKELTQIVAALGREFSSEELRAVTDLEDAQLEQQVEDLLDAGLVYRRGVPPRAVYVFKHALIQDTAYRSMLPDTLRLVHGRIALGLEAAFPERLRQEPESIARHYELAGMLDEAIEAYRRAGSSAAMRCANAEAIAHLTRALDLIAAAPGLARREARELPLRLAIGAPLASSRGFGSLDVNEAYERAMSLARELDAPAELADALDGLVACFVTQSRLREASELAVEQLRLAEELDEPERLLGAHYCLALVHYFEGDPERSIVHFEQFDGHYDPEQHGDLISIRGENLGVAAAIWQAWALWIAGFPDRAVEAARTGIARAQRGAHPFSLAYAHAWTAVLLWNRRDRADAIQHSEKAVRIAGEYGFPLPLGVGRLAGLRSLPREALGDHVLQEAETILVDLAATGTKAAIPQILCGAAEVCLECDDPEKAKQYIEAAFLFSKTTGQPHWDAELHRVKAELLSLQEPEATSEVERLLREGVEIARRQRARSLELRAATVLARLLHARGEDEAAASELAERAGWFQEGLDTEDLVAAHALLAEIAATANA